MIKNGETTTSEFWDRQGVQNIPSLSGPCENWFYYALAGIRPDPAAPGFKNTIIRPAFVKDLTWLKAHHDSPFGRIAVDWKRKDGQLTLNVTVPPNSSATVYIPGENINESGMSVDRANGVALVGRENGCSVLNVQSGSYSFSGSF